MKNLKRKNLRKSLMVTSRTNLDNLITIRRFISQISNKEDFRRITIEVTSNKEVSKNRETSKVEEILIEEESSQEEDSSREEDFNKEEDHNKEEDSSQEEDLSPEEDFRERKISKNE